MEAIEYPTITLGDEPRVPNKEFVVRFRGGDIIRLKKAHNINLLAQLDFKLNDGLENCFAILAAGVAHQQAFTVEEIADLVDYASVGEVISGILEALGKVSARSRAMLEATMARIAALKPPQVPEAEKTPVVN